MSPSDSPPRPALFVCETEPYWLPELERQFLGRRTVRAGEADAAWLTATSSSLDAEPALLVATGDWLLEHLEVLQARMFGRTSGLPRLVVVLRSEAMIWEWPLRELGVSAVVDEFIGGRRLAQVCERLLSARQAIAPATA